MVSLPVHAVSERIRPGDLPAVEVPGLYVHIPFCFHKCHYCDFYSITRQTPDRMQRFVDLLLAEAAQWTSPGGPVVRPRTIFFGGGTPTLLPMDAMRRLLEGLRARFDLSGVNEWTVEANPATLSLEYAHMLRDMGVDRLSFGAQSFDPAELKQLERHHDPEDVPRSVEIARSAGFERVNIDLIYAIPGQTLESWSRSLESAIALGTDHLSCYGLTYEPSTPLAVRRRMGQIVAVEEPVELAMLHHTRRRLREAGLPAYEISNYARPGQECRHNLLYWTQEDYIGLGPSAASHVRGHRWKNRPHLGEWESAVGRGVLPADEYEALTERQRAGELAMLMLRLERGLDYAEYAARSGIDARVAYAQTIERLSQMGLIEVSERGIRLSEKGLDIADSVAGEFL